MKYILATATLILIVSTVSVFSSEKLYSPIFWFISSNTNAICPALIHLKRTSSNRLLVGYLIVFILFYNWLNYEPSWGIESIFYIGTEQLNYLSRTLLTLLLIGFGISQLLTGGLFEELRTKRVFWASIVLLTIFLITEIPMYNVHGDFGGDPHGHNYLKGFHFHK